MRHDLRHEKLISQHIDVALIYKDMLGLDDAQAYLNRENIPQDITERVLFTERKRHGGKANGTASSGPGTVYACRRRNRIHDAIVEAALKIERTLGPGWALALLRDEQVPEEVAARIIAQGPRQLRTRNAGSPFSSAVIPAAR